MAGVPGAVAGFQRAGRAACWLLVAAAVLLLGACGSSTTATSANNQRGASGGESKTELPGTREFGLTDEQFAEHVEQTQSLIAECMGEAGFEYIPVDVQTVEAAQERVRRDPGDTRVGYKQKYGYGETTRFDNPVRDIGLGPNLKIWKSLPAADQEAYARTLWGEDFEADFVWTMDEEDFSGTGGCTRKAIAQVFTPEQLKGTYVNPKDVLVEQDPRIIEADRKWQECMAAKGYEYEDQDEIIEEFQDRLDELTEGEDPRTLTGARKAQLGKLQQEEIAASLADVDCEIKHTDEVYAQVELEVFGDKVSG